MWTEQGLQSNVEFSITLNKIAEEHERLIIKIG